MRITVRYISILLRDVTGRSSEAIETDGEGVALRQLLDGIASRHGERFRSTLYSEDGAIQPHFHVLVNGQSARFLDGMQTIVRDGDTVSFITPIGGG